MLTGFAARRSWGWSAAGAASTGLLAFALLMIFLVAPREVTMGDVQRIVYLHVAVAWCGLSGFVLTAILGILFLVRRDLAWDNAAQATAEVGWICTTLTLMTGSLWAHEAWNTWWTWEPRLTASLILWMIYGGYFLVRNSLDDHSRRARISSVLALLGLADVPLVLLATRWFRGIHPVTPEMDPRMRLVLLTSVIAFTLFFTFLGIARWRQLQLAQRLDDLTVLPAD